MSCRSLYAVAAVVASLSFAVMLAKAPPVVVAAGAIVFAFALAVVVALLTYTPRYAIAGWQSDTVCVESIPVGFQVEQAPPVCVMPCGGSAACDCLVERPVVKRKANTPRTTPVKRVAAKATKPTTVAPRKPRVRKSAPTAS